MKRVHRRWHRLVWPLWVLGTLAMVGLAQTQRPAVPQNPVWPPTLAAAST
jgi:hypothetical protein